MAGKIGSDNKEKSLYLAQIQYLDEQLERCQLKCDKLEKENKHLASQYSALEKDKKDITEYLKRSVAAKEKKVEELAESLGRQQRAAEQDREALQLQHGRQMQELREQTEELTSERRAQATKIEEQKEQLMQLRQQLSDTESLGKQLAGQKEEHEAAFHISRMNAVLEKEKMIKDLKHKVHRHIQTEASNILQIERAQHSKRREQVQYMQSKREPLQRERDILRDRERDVLVRRNSLEKDLKQTTKKSFMHKKEVEQLREKWQHLEVELEDLSITHQTKLGQIEDLKQCLASAIEELHQKTAEVVQLESELEKNRSRNRQLEGVKQDAAIIARHIPTGLEKASETQWWLQRLLEIVDSTAPQGTGSTHHDPSKRGHRLQTFGPKLTRQYETSSPVDPSAPTAQQTEPEAGASTSADC